MQCTCPGYSFVRNGLITVAVCLGAASVELSVYRPNSWPSFAHLLCFLGLLLLLGPLRIGCTMRYCTCLGGTLVALWISLVHLRDVIDTAERARQLGFTDLTQIRALLPSIVRGIVPGESLIYLILLLPCPMALSFWPGSRKYWRLLALLAVSVIFLAVLSTFERASVVACLIFVAVGSSLAVAVQNDGPWRIGRWFAPPALAIGILACAHNESLLSLLQINATTSQARSTSGRLHILHIAKCMIETYPLVGTGPGSFPLAYGRFDDRRDKFLHASRAYNLPVEVAAEYGVPFAASMFLLIAIIMMHGYQRLRTQTLSTCRIPLNICLTAGVCSAISRDMFYSSIFSSYETSLMFGVMLAAIASDDTRGGAVR